MTVTCIETVMEKLSEIDLCAGRRLRIEVQIMNVDIPVCVSFSNVSRYDFFQIEVLACFLPGLKHDTHRLGTVYVCVLAPPVRAIDYAVYTAQGGKEIVFQTAVLAVLLSIENVGFSNRRGRSAQVVLDLILNILHTDRLVFVQVADKAFVECVHQRLCDLCVNGRVTVYFVAGLEHRIENLILVERYDVAVPFLYINRRLPPTYSLYLLP